MNIDPKGRMPPNSTIAHGSMNHFFSGIGLGTVLTLQGLSGSPEMFLPRIVPTRFRGRITKRQIHTTVTWEGCGTSLKHYSMVEHYGLKKQHNRDHILTMHCTQIQTGFAQGYMCVLCILEQLVLRS